MALNIGELTGFLDLDAGPFESGIGKAFGMLGDKKWQVAGAAAGVAAATALAGGLVSATDAEGAVNKLSAQLGLTKDESAKAGKIAGELYANNYGESMEDVTAATGAVMSSIAGMRTASEADVVSVTGKMMSLASAMEVDVAEAASTVGSLMKNGLATDATQAMDMIAGSMQQVPTTMRGEILPIMDEYGKHFAALGIDGETAFGIIVASAADGAIGMDKMGDALKEFTIRGTDMSKSTTEVYESLGLSTEEMTNSLLAGGDTAEGAMAQIVAGLSSIEDPGAQAAAAIALFGTPLEDLGTNAIPEFLGMVDPLGDAFDSTAGAVTDLDTTLNSGAGASIKTFTRTAKQTLSDLGATVLPILTPILQNLSEWAPTVGPIVLALGAFAVAIWAVSAGMTAFGVVKGIIDAIKVWTGVQWGLNVAMSSNVIALIVLGIVALIAIIIALVMNWDTVVAFLQDAWAGFVGWFMGVMDGFLSWWSGVWGGFLGFWGDAFTAAKIVATNIWTGIVDWIKGIPGWILNAIRPIAELHIQVALWILAIKDAAVQKFNDIVNWVKGVPGMILAGLMAIAQIHIQMGQWIGGVKDAAVNKFIELVSWVSGLPGRILSSLGNLGSLLVNAGAQIIQGFLDGLKRKYEDVKSFIGGIGEWIANNKGPKAYDLALLVPAGGWIMTGLTKGLAAYMPTLGRQLNDISWMIQNGIDPELGINGSYAFSGVRSMLPGAQQTPTAGTVYNQTFNVEKVDAVDPETQMRGLAEQIMWKR